MGIGLTVYFSFAVLVIFILIFLGIHEIICTYRNPFPLFRNGDKRFSEILKDKTKDYKTRSILKDINYDKK